MPVITSFGSVLLTGRIRLSPYGRQSSMPTSSRNHFARRHSIFFSTLGWTYGNLGYSFRFPCIQLVVGTGIFQGIGESVRMYSCVEKG